MFILISCLEKRTIWSSRGGGGGSDVKRYYLKNLYFYVKSKLSATFSQLCHAKTKLSKKDDPTRFRCLVEKCGGEHHTLMHRPSKPLSDGKAKGSGKNEEQMDKTGMTTKDQQIGDNNRACNSTKDDDGSLVGATGVVMRAKYVLVSFPLKCIGMIVMNSWRHMH